MKKFPFYNIKALLNKKIVSEEPQTPDEVLVR